MRIRGAKLIALRLRQARHLRNSVGLCALADGALTDLGWIASWREGAIRDASGPIPWYTYAATQWLSQVTRKGSRVLEVGSGASTAWWALRGCQVRAIEESEEWATRTEELLRALGVASLVDIIRVPNADRAREAILRCQDRFDVVINDGVEPRSDLARPLLSKLKPDGFFVWDNADRAEYQEAISELVASGLWILDFDGLGPASPRAWKTSVLGRGPIHPGDRVQATAG